MNYAAKRDAIESDVVEALEQIGVTVERISSPGAPDLVTYRADVGIRLLECKSKVGKPTTAQRKFRIPFTTVRSTAEALALYGVQMRGPTDDDLVCECGHHADWHGNSGKGHCGATRECRSSAGCKQFKRRSYGVKA